MKRLPKLKLVYQFVPPEPGDEEALQQEVGQAFNVLFDMALTAELEAQRAAQVSKQNEVPLAAKSTVDNSEQLGIS